MTIMSGAGMNLITTIVGFGMSATFIVFVCTRLICGRLRRMEARHMLDIDSRLDAQLPENRLNGLELAVVAAIPTMKFNREAFNSTENTQCSICLSEYQEKEVLRIMPNCGHSFHLSCIDVWLRKQSTCPVCRVSVQDSIETTSAVNPRQSFDGSEISIEHSQQWLLPIAARGERNGIDQTNLDSISIELDSGVSRDATSRS